MTSPVLFLGLGGTGKEALMHLRRLFLDEYAGDAMPEALRVKYGSARLPHTAFLCLDSDDRMEDIDGKKFDEFLLSARFSGAEFLNIELDPNRVRDLYDYPERYPEYAQWYDFSLERSGVPKHGCGQTRPWGRLAFFQHYTRIRERLRTVLLGLVAIDVQRDAEAIGAQALNTGEIEVYVVFSVAGGTGSGLFLDMAFLLKDLSTEIGRTIKAQAIVLLPSAFSSDPTSRVYANGYAGLMEIEYYNLKREGAADSEGRAAAARGVEGVFPIYWPGASRPGEVKTLSGPVFESIWLIDRRSRGIDGRSVTIGEDRKSELTAMMAEWMFLRSAPRLRLVGQEINTDASNYTAVNMLQTERIPIYETGEYAATGAVELSCRYGAFGVAKIFVPTSVVRQIAGDTLVADIVTRWTQATGAAPSDEDLERDIRPATMLRRPSQDSRDSRGEAALFDLVDWEGESGGLGIVREAANRFSETFHPDMAEDAGPQLAAVLRDRFRDFQWSATSDQALDSGLRGQYAERIRVSLNRARERIQAGLDTTVARALATADRRFDFAEAVLGRLMVEFGDVAERARGRAADLAGDMEATVRDRDTLLGHAADTRSRFVLRTVAKVAIDDQARLTRLELEAQIWRGVAEMAADTAARIGQARADGAVARASMISDLRRLKGDLERLRERLAERVRGLAGRHESALNLQVVPSDPGLYYLDEKGAPAGEGFIRRAETRLYGDAAVFGAAGGAPSPWALRDRFSGAEGENLIAALSRHGRAEMRHVSAASGDVATLMGRRFSGQGGERDWADAIRQYAQAGTAWLAIREDRRAGAWESVQHYIVARPGGGGREPQRLETVFQNAFGELHAGFVDGPDEAIYFQQQLAAFPLSVVPGIKDYRDKAYLPLLRREPRNHSEARGGGGGLHIELNIEKYVDLVEPTIEEATLRAQAIQTFIEGLVKGRLTPLRDRFGMIHYASQRTAGMSTVTDDLGRYDRAVRHLMDPLAPATQALRRQNENVEVWWDAQPDKGLVTKGRILAILDRFINAPAASPVRGAEWVRNAQRLNDRLVRRWGDAAYASGAGERAEIDRWAVLAPEGGGHVTPPDLPPIETR